MKIEKSYFILLSLLLITTSMIAINSNNVKIGFKDSIDNIDLKVSASYFSPITINGLPKSQFNWSWAKSQGYCTGFGTVANPYIIQNHIFNTFAFTGDDCLTIQNSREYFIIRNCQFLSYYFQVGIHLINVTNGLMTNNHNIPLSGALFWLQNSSYNVISSNNASFNFLYGIFLEGGINYQNTHNIISHNVVENNTDTGILLDGYDRKNVISNNLVSNNGDGIRLEVYSNNNTIIQNVIKTNVDRGLDITTLSAGNEIYLNCFNNTINARDDGLNNQWDNGVRGNYWDDYLGEDVDNNGIGDSPYTIGGKAGAEDNFPFMSCPLPWSEETGTLPGFHLYILIGISTITIIGLTMIILKKKKDYSLKMIC